MCTVSFLPGLPRGGYLLATNRDESPRRLPALPPFAAEIGGRLVLAPRDADAGGTWVGVDEAGFALTVLNGDRPAAAPPPAEAVSRGRLVLDLLACRSPEEVRAELSRRERAGALRFKPFKLVAVGPGVGAAPARAVRADWNGAALAWSVVEGPACIVSSTIEPEGVEAARGAAFSTLLESVRPLLRADLPSSRLEDLASDLHDFHASHAEGAAHGDAFSVCMHRTEARTVSCTLIVVGDDQVRMHYQAGWPCEDGAVQVTEMARPTSAPGREPS